MKTKINLDEYRRFKPRLIELIEKRGYDKINELAAGTSFPIIVLYHFWGEEKGFDKETIRTLKVLKEFYNYKYEVPNE